MKMRPPSLYTELARERLKEIGCNDLPQLIQSDLIENFSNRADSVLKALATRHLTLPRISRAFLRVSTRQLEGSKKILGANEEEGGGGFSPRSEERQSQ